MFTKIIIPYILSSHYTVLSLTMTNNLKTSVLFRLNHNLSLKCFSLVYCATGSSCLPYSEKIDFSYYSLIMFPFNQPQEPTSTGRPGCQDTLDNKWFCRPDLGASGKQNAFYPDRRRSEERG